MPGDYSRFTFDPTRHYSQVRMQQGRVQLDADWNEQAAITAHMREAALRDLVGPCGVSKDSDAYLMQRMPDSGPFSDIGILPGRCYVNGHVAINEASPVPATRLDGQQNELSPAVMSPDGQAYQTGQWLEASSPSGRLLTQISAVDESTGTLSVADDLSNLDGDLTVRRIASYLQQPHDPAPEFSDGAGQLQLDDGDYLAYLDLWQQEVTGLDDPHLLESALGGADTTTRVQTLWRVGLVAVDGDSDCSAPIPDAATEVPDGRMNARTRPPDTQDDVCQLPPTAGYRRLENQLYRVEVQRGGDLASATFKWSRDNAIVSTQIELINGRVLNVADVGRDDILGFAENQWVEIVSDRSRLRGEPNDLFVIESVDPASRQVTLTESAAALAGENGLQLRRWDQTGDGASASGVSMGSDWVALESGVEVLFSAGSYRAGDYWLIPARTSTGEIEWPPYAVPNTDPVPQLPRGVEHHYCRLARLQLADGELSVVDCREAFPPLTDICAEDVCFDNSQCQMPQAETVQDALDALCARPIGGGPIITGVVIFNIANSDQDEFISRFIDTGLGRGRLQVVLGLEQGENEPIFVGAVDVFEALSYPSVLAGAEVRPSDGHLRVAIRIQNRETVGARVRVRWWATQPAADAGEVVVGTRPTIGPTISPTLVPPTGRPTIGPTISPTLVPPTGRPTIGPTVSPTLVPPTGRPTVSPTLAPTLAPTGRPTVRPTVSPTISTTVRPGVVTTGRPIRSGQPRPLTDVRGVGDAFAERLSSAGIADASALAASDVETVRRILGISEVRSRGLIEEARALGDA